MNLEQLIFANKIYPFPSKPRYYLDIYQHYFKDLENEPIKLLELGVNYGGSLKMWSYAFPKGRIVGIDTRTRATFDEERIKTYKGDQTDTDFLKEVLKEEGDFNIIIDDCSHFSYAQITSFDFLFPRMVKGGVYAIEDLQTSFWTKYGTEDNMLDYLLSLAKIPTIWATRNHKSGVAREEKHPFEKLISSVHFYNSLCLVFKNGLGFYKGEAPTIREEK